MQDREPRSEPGHDDVPPHRMPGWVRAFVVGGALLLVLVVLAFALGRGDHGPSRHVPGGGEEQVESDEGGGHQPPVQHP